jgi:2-keto-3-deoxy-L-rhamnonate aldolase RhmA
MKPLRQRALRGEVLAGTWLNLASSLTAEMAGRAGFDWLLLDREHGVGDSETLLHQLQAIDCTPACAVVRIAWNDAARFKLALDLGPSGIMVPYVNTAEEARQAVAAMRYPPQGVRGVARFNRAAGFSMEFDRYFAEANASLLTVIQIETPEAVANAAEIAAIDGVDVLFVGPLDLSVNLGIPQQFAHPDFRAAIAKVIAAAKGAGKAAGTLLANAEQIALAIADGYTFIAVGSDGGLVANGMKSLAAAFANPADG